MPQLDGLRAFAVTAVLLHHFLEMKGFDWAFEGVRLFFVLSGFLITGILLQSRELAESRGDSLGGTIRRFYARRALRIFPLYYFLILIGLVINLEPAREALGWFLTYSLNIYMAHQGWYVDNYAHFWSLAVEEQFYIVWPWLVLFAPRRWLLPLILAVISIGPLFRFYCVIQEYNGIVAYISTPGCLDSLGMGALLTITAHSRAKDVLQSYLRKVALPVGLVASGVLLLLLTHPVFWKVSTIFYDSALALFFCWLIYSASVGFRGIVRVVLESPPLTYVGKISYGIYVYHPFMPKLCMFIFRVLGFDYPKSRVLTFILPTVATMIVASISWYIMERPLNNLKRCFEDHKATGDRGKLQLAPRRNPSASSAGPRASSCCQAARVASR